MRFAHALGDAGGIAPELAAKMLADATADQGDMIVIGDFRLLARGAEQAGITLDMPTIVPADLAGDLPAGPVLLDLANADPDAIPVGRSSNEAGHASLQNFAAALLMGKAGLADLVVFTPFNKRSMRLAWPDYVDEIGFIDATIGAERSGREFNILDEVWNARVTSHIPLREVAGALSVERIVHSLELTGEVMVAAGFQAPRIGVAALNPHAGDGGNFGTEDDTILTPAVAQAQAKGLAVTGPIPSDTVFVRAVKGEFDAVMTMYHDQGQIAMKLLGFDRGVTLIAGYPFPIVTPAHGCAYDIAAQGKADSGASLHAVALGRKLAGLRSRPPATEADRREAARRVAVLLEPATAEI